MSLIDMLNAATLGGSRKRNSLSESELSRRLELYKETYDDMEITDEHESAMRSIFCDLSNVLITGGAGTGKTTFVRDLIIQELEHRGLNFAVTATTGIAGSHLNGKTIHSWAGIGLGPYFPPSGTPPQERDADELQSFYDKTYDEWSASPRGSGMRAGVKKRIESVEVLIIDEISMCAGNALLGYLDFFFRKIRTTKQELPFGGIQIIFVGDFCQLPPVDKWNHDKADWAFLCPAWECAGVVTCELTKVFRQADRVFADFLNKIRKGEPTDPEYLKGFVRRLTHEESMKASYLVPTNAKADKLNDMVLDMYPGPTAHLDAKFTIHRDLLAPYETVDKVTNQLEQAMRGRRRLSLRIGVPVLFAVNDRDGEYVNGTKGEVVGLLGKDGKPATEDVDTVEISIPARGDVEAKTIKLSRITTTRNQKEDPAETTSLNGATVSAYPTVRQFPLVPATAITIHRCQGMSLDECVVDLQQSFAPGHVYVAMSRLRTAKGLTLVSDRFNVLVDQDVMAFYNSRR